MIGSGVVVFQYSPSGFRFLGLEGVVEKGGVTEGFVRGKARLREPEAGGNFGNVSLWRLPA